MVKDACGGWIAINKNFETPFKDYQKQVMPYLECAEYVASPQPDPVCMNGVCQTISHVAVPAEKPADPDK